MCQVNDVRSKVIIITIYYWIHNISGYNVYNNSAADKGKKEQNYIGAMSSMLLESS